jgi:hypothetical protein
MAGAADAIKETALRNSVEFTDRSSSLGRLLILGERSTALLSRVLRLEDPNAPLSMVRVAALMLAVLARRHLS